jgi:hypothetical protein
MRPLPRMPFPAGRAEPAAAVQPREGRQRHLLAGREALGPVEIVPAPAGVCPPGGRRLEDQLPRAAPGQLAAPYLAALLGGRAVRIEGEPGIELVAGGSAAALQHELAGSEAGLGKLGLGSPAAVQAAQPPSVARGQPPVGRPRLPEGDGVRAAMPDPRPSPQDVEAVVGAVEQGHLESVGGVREVDLQGDRVAVAVAPLPGEPPLDGPRLVRVVRLERRLVVAHAAPRHVFVGGLIRPGETALPAGLADGREHARDRVRAEPRPPVQVAQR